MQTSSAVSYTHTHLHGAGLSRPHRRRLRDALGDIRRSERRARRGHEAGRCPDSGRDTADDTERRALTRRSPRKATRRGTARAPSVGRGAGGAPSGARARSPPRSRTCRTRRYRIERGGFDSWVKFALIELISWQASAPCLKPTSERWSTRPQVAPPGRAPSLLPAGGGGSSRIQGSSPHRESRGIFPEATCSSLDAG